MNETGCTKDARWPSLPRYNGISFCHKDLFVYLYRINISGIKSGQLPFLLLLANLL